ncbi:unnamed protein product [Ectocarpus sp. 6 AP-2014]
MPPEMPTPGTASPGSRRAGRPGRSGSPCGGSTGAGSGPDAGSPVGRSVVAAGREKGDGKTKGQTEYEEEDDSDDSDDGGHGERKVSMLRKTWTNEAWDTYYTEVRVGDSGGGGSETYRCGDCAVLETDSGKYPAEIVHIFKDRHGEEWVEVRWLYTKEEIEETVPKRWWPDMDDAELLETNDVIANHPASICYPVRVHSHEHYMQKEKAGEIDVDTAEPRDFFCRKFYDVRLKRFMPEAEQRTAQRLLRGRRWSERSSKPGGDGRCHPSLRFFRGWRAGPGGVYVFERPTVTPQTLAPSPHSLLSTRPHNREVDHCCQRRPSSSAGAGGGGGKRRDSKGKRRPQDKFSVAMESLHVTAVPKSLPCRNDERNQLLSFLTSNIKAGGLGNALFVAGMPGTGKTATAHEVVRILKGQQARGLLPRFKLVELNGMRLTEPHQAYPQLWMALSGEMLSPKRALYKLEKYFSRGDPSREFVVLLVDELDYMTTRKQTVLYNLFEWPSRRNARLVVVGIANTIDLPERCLPRVSSRVTSRLTFGPYTKLQLAEILQARLVEANAIGGKASPVEGKANTSVEGKAFDNGAINMAAAKVASSSGDMRMCLKYCRRAIEVCKARVESAKEDGNGDKVSWEVSVKDVHVAVREINEQAHLVAVRDSAPQERLLLVAITNEVHLGGKGVVDMDDVRTRMEGICRAHPNGPRMPNVTTILEMISRLAAAQVLELVLSRRTPLPDVELNMTVRDVVQMLRDDEGFSRKVLPDALVSEYPMTSSLPG